MTDHEQNSTQGAELGPILVVVALLAIIIGGGVYTYFHQSKDDSPSNEVITEQLPDQSVQNELSLEETPVQEDEEIQEEPEEIKDGITVIKEYYTNLENGDLDTAYAMYSEAFTDPKTFEQWYGSITYIAPYNFVTLGGNTYRFLVDIKETGKDDETYQVKMEVNENKIKTLSSVQSRVVLSNEKQFVYERQYRSKAELVYESAGKITVIAEGDDYRPQDYANSDQTIGLAITIFEDVELSQSGRYLSFNQGFGVEGGGGAHEYKLFDTAKRKVIYSSRGTTQKLSSNEQHLMDCSDNEMIGEFYAKVIELPSLDILFDAERDTQIVNELSFYGIECRFIGNKDGSIEFYYDNVIYAETPVYYVEEFTLTYNPKKDEVRFESN